MTATVYRAFDVDGALLYIGATTSISTRLTAHQASSPWWDKTTRVDLEHFSTRDEAFDAEHHAIADEHPIWNRRGTGSYRAPIDAPLVGGIPNRYFIADWMRLKSITALFIVRRTGWSPERVADLIDGVERPISAETAVTLANALECNPRALLIVTEATS